MFCSNLVVGPIHRDLSSQAQTLLVHVNLVPWHFIKKTIVSPLDLGLEEKTFNIFVSFEMIPPLSTTICKNLVGTKLANLAT